MIEPTWLLYLHVDIDYHLDSFSDSHDSIFDDDWTFFANLSERAIREELTTLTRSARQTYITLSLAGSSCCEALWTYRAAEEKSRLEKNMNILTS